MPTFNVDPSAQLAMKGALVGLAAALNDTPISALDNAAAFAAKASKNLKAKVDKQNTDYLAALSLAFANASQPIPPIAPLATPIDLTPIIPPQPAVPPVPVIPNITITFAPDGVTPLTISF